VTVRHAVVGLLIAALIARAVPALAQGPFHIHWECPNSICAGLMGSQALSGDTGSFPTIDACNAALRPLLPQNKPTPRSPEVPKGSYCTGTATTDVAAIVGKGLGNVLAALPNEQALPALFAGAWLLGALNSSDNAAAQKAAADRAAAEAAQAEQQRLDAENLRKLIELRSRLKGFDETPPRMAKMEMPSAPAGPRLKLGDTGSAFVQVKLPAMPEIPVTLPDEIRQALIAKRAPLAQRKLTLIENDTALNKNCTGLVPGSSQHQRCLAQQAQLNADVLALSPQMAALADEINAAMRQHTINSLSALRSDWSMAARLLDDAMTTYGVSAPAGSIEASVVKAAGEMIGQDGLLAFQQTNNEYRLAKDSTLPLFNGSPVANARYESERDTLAKRAAYLQAGIVKGEVVDADLLAAINALNTAAASVERFHLPNTANPSVAQLADELRRTVLMQALDMSLLTATNIHLRAQGENDALTIEAIRQAQALCEGSSDAYCAHRRAIKLKALADERFYPAWRNAEHFLFSRALASDTSSGLLAAVTGRATPVLGAASLLPGVAGYAVWKSVYPDAVKFGSSPPSVEQIKWGYRGMIVGLTGKLDPSQAPPTPPPALDMPRTR
jgi:hypothetical protein